MAIEEQVARLKASIIEDNGCEAWNRWRKDDRWQTEIDLKEVDLSHARLRAADLTHADLTYATLTGVDCLSADLSYADLTHAVFTGVDPIGVDFGHVHLVAAYKGADLTGIHFTHADLTGADLTNTNLTDADLTDANLTDAVLSGAYLIGATLIGAHLNNADLTRAVIRGADLTHADFSGAKAGSLIFSGVNLSGVCGLESVQHFSSSTIGSDTFYKSHGNIPDVFLRGCGVPDSMIEFAHALVNAENPIDYYSCFISYNHEDEAFATRLYNDLQSNNVRCWKYTEDVKIGNNILAHVDEAIRLHEKLIVIFSEHSAQSDWVAAEVEAALDREQQEGREILFPVTIDNAVKHTYFGWAAKIRRNRNIGDFTAWKDQDQYQPMFDRLLRDLKAD